MKKEVRDATGAKSEWTFEMLYGDGWCSATDLARRGWTPRARYFLLGPPDRFWGRDLRSRHRSTRGLWAVIRVLCEEDTPTFERLTTGPRRKRKSWNSGLAGKLRQARADLEREWREDEARLAASDEGK
jgi:hypothetical protein